ncbi:MAG: thiamine-phosphate kinase [Planctomycetaceae bacterium]
MTSEREFIRQLAKRFPERPPVQIGIGDDGAVIDCSNATQQIIVTDMLLDGVHFDLKHTSPGLAGRKSVAVNLSDLAAMACRPTSAFLSLAVPRSLTSPDEFLNSLYEGIAALANRYGFCVAGGDTNSWDGPFAINVCLTGVPMAANPVLRSGAKPGDVLIVTGPLGGSLTTDRHLTFEPRLAMAEWLVNNVAIHSMIDVSDGLSIDLSRMMEASGTGAILRTNRIPIHPDVSADLPFDDRLRRAFSDGEDFELLLAVSPADLSLIESAPADVGCHVIGNVTQEPGLHVITETGDRSPLQVTGWQHL